MTSRINIGVYRVDSIMTAKSDMQKDNISAGRVYRSNLFMKEVENKQAFYNNGIYFNWKIHLMVPRIKLLKRSWKMVCFFRESGILQPSVIVTASGVKLST